MSVSQRRMNVPGWIGLACLAFIWLVMLVPKLIPILKPALDVLGPFQWLIVLGMIVLPAIAGRRGSKWWVAVAAAAITTFVVFLRIVLD